MPLPKLILFLPAILWFTIITVLLMLPLNFPQVVEFNLLEFDKVVHLTFLFLLVHLFQRPFLRRHDSTVANRLVMIFIAGIMYGIVIEFIQKYWVPNRAFDIGDIVADTIGCIIAQAYAMILRRKYLKK